MRNGLHAWLGTFLFGAGCLIASAAQAQTISSRSSIALKNGETLELTDAYMISTSCRSLLIGTPEVEILDGPPGVSATVKAARVTPRYFDCAKPVAGGKVFISANDVDAFSYSTMTLRFRFRTRDGERRFSQVLEVSLFP